MIVALAFYVFAAILIASAVMVVTARNSVHSVLYLILAFFNAAALFLIAGAEFLAMILVIVYVGAVAVLFLFVVMMLDIDFVQIKEGFQRYVAIGGIIGGMLFLELLFVYGAWQFADDAQALRMHPMPPDVATNTQALGSILYTDYIFPFQASGLILLVAMIGAIVLTLREKPANSRRQNIAVQVARGQAVTMKDVPKGAGLAEMGGIIRRPLPEPKKPKTLAHDDHGHGHGDHHDSHGGGHH